MDLTVETSAGNATTSNETPSIGIVMAIYNGEKYLEETLRNVQLQSVRDWQCICVDDGSKDNTAAIVERLAREDSRFKLVRQPNAGPSAARNHGYRHLHPAVQYVTFLDGDDFWVEGGLQTLRDALEQHPEMVAAYGLAENIDENGAIMGPGSYPEYGRNRRAWKNGKLVPLPLSEPTSFASIAYHCAIVPPNLILIRRAALDKVGLFDPALWVIPDWDLWLRLSRLSDLCFVNQVVALYRRHSNNFSKENPRTRKENIYLTIKAFYSPENTPEQQQYVKLSYRKWQKERMAEKFGYAKDSWPHAPHKALIYMVHVAIHAIRYLRGQPARRG
jgi:glycosyltransferase involved in cell wall biosynthesis